MTNPTENPHADLKNVSLNVSPANGDVDNQDTSINHPDTRRSNQDTSINHDTRNNQDTPMHYAPANQDMPDRPSRRPTSSGYTRKLTPEQERDIWRMRCEGATFQACADKFNLTRAGARYIIFAIGGGRDPTPSVKATPKQQLTPRKEYSRRGEE